MAVLELPPVDFPPVVPPITARVQQQALSWFADVRPGEEAALAAVLTEMASDPAGNDVLPFGELTGLHFGRLILLDPTPATDDHGAYPAKLCLLTDFDGDLEPHLDDLLATAGPGLDRLLRYCEGYPAAKRDQGTEVRDAFVREHVARTNTVYINTAGRTVQQIRQEAALHEAIDAFLDAGDWTDATPRQIRAAIQDFVNSRHDLGWAMAPLPERTLGDWVRGAPGLAKTPLAIVATAPLWLPVLPFWAAALLAKEATDETHDHLEPDEAHAARLAALEDHTPQNQFAAFGFVKEGPFRNLTANVLLRVTDYVTRYSFNRGQLTGVTTIHFARWVFTDDDQKRLLFASNYDGSLESYMDDFIDKVAWGLNAVFSNGVGYPRTWLLTIGGARQEDEFKDYLRRHQVPSQVWFSAYPQLTAMNIENNAQIRAGLVGEISDSGCEKWLARV
ncbi:MAG: hypothetical protein JHD16_06110 [Solirubrobacteraceae bacterium]|nr:hypothetical protein [Solirubrobacteraceae bacterium]